jgi:hypothetical protein
MPPIVLEVVGVYSIQNATTNILSNKNAFISSEHRVDAGDAILAHNAVHNL